MTEPPAAGPSRWTVPALVLATVAAGYLRALGAPFQFDDRDWIAGNPALAPPLDLGAIWRFRPGRFLPDLAFALNRLVAGESPAALRAVNLAVHFAASLLTGWIAAELWRQAAGRGARAAPAAAEAERAARTAGALAALLFAAHPLATQAVTYLTQRITSLTALVELAAVAAFLRARRPGREAWWWVCWTLALLAALGKEMAAALPLALVAIEGVLRAAGAGRRAPAWRLAPPFAAIPLVLWLASAPLGPDARRFAALGETLEFTRLEYALTQLTVIPRYLALFAWPRGQQLDPWIALRTAPDGAVIAGAALLAALTLGALGLARRAPLVAIGWLWFLVTIAPESSVVPIRDLMNEHRAYLPMAGLAWIAAALVAPWVAARRAGKAAAAVALAALTLATARRNETWRSERALWGDTVRHSPRSARAQNNYGLALARDGAWDEAERAFRAAIAAEPRHVYARVNLGMLYARERRGDEALAVLLEAADLAPRDPLVLNNLGTAWWARGDTARAAASYLRALEADPAAKFPRGNLARMRSGAPPP